MGAEIDLSIPMWSFYYFGPYNHTMNYTPYGKLLIKMKHPEDTETTANLIDDLNQVLDGDGNFIY